MTLWSGFAPSHADFALGAFLKAPRVGEVKTRLGAEIGMHSACRVYAAVLEDVIERLHRLSGGTVTFFIGQEDGLDDCEMLLERLGFQPSSVMVRAQRGTGLGERLRDAAEFLLQRRAKAVIIGTDTPMLSPEHVEAAAAALDRAEVVFGPAVDGGYYLLGLRRMLPCLFDGVPWSTPEVLRVSLERLRGQGVRFGLLGEEIDVDCLDDLRRLHRVLRDSPAETVARVPRTWEACEKLLGRPG